MKRIRIGKDISMRWEITTDGVAIPLEGRDLTIEIKSPAGIENNIPYRVEGNILIMTYYGYEQKRPGEYSITLWEKKGKPGQNVVDVIRAFELVRTSQEEDDFVGGDLQIESVDLGTENFDILTEGGYRAINIDTLQAEALYDSVNIKGNTYSNESFTITLPKANLDAAGVMSADDKHTLQDHGNSISQLESTTSGHSNAISQINAKLDEHTESINAKITTDRIEDGAVTTEKIATSAFDSTLSVSGKIAPADVVGEKFYDLEYKVNRELGGEIILGSPEAGYITSSSTWDAGGTHNVVKAYKGMTFTIQASSRASIYAFIKSNNIAEPVEYVGITRSVLPAEQSVTITAEDDCYLYIGRKNNDNLDYTPKSIISSGIADVINQQVKNNSEIISDIENKVDAITGSSKEIAPNGIGFVSVNVGIGNPLPTERTSPNKNWRYWIIDVVPNQKFIITGRGGKDSRLWAFGDSNGNLLDISEASYDVLELNLIVPSNAVKLYINSDISLRPDTKVSLYSEGIENKFTRIERELSETISANKTEIDNKLTELKEEVNGEFTNIYDYIKQRNIEPIGFGFISTNVGIGNHVHYIPDSPNKDWCYYIADVREGQIITITGKGGRDSRLWAFADNADILLDISDASLELLNKSIVVPVGAKKVIINSNIAYSPNSKVYLSNEYNLEELSNRVEKLKDRHQLNVLVFGNSYSIRSTAQGDANILNLFKSVGVDAFVEVVGNGGGSFASNYNKHLKNEKNGYRTEGDTKSGFTDKDSTPLTYVEALQLKKWDYIIFHQASALSGNIDSFSPFLQNLIDIAKLHCDNENVKFGLMETWAYANNEGTYPTNTTTPAYTSQTEMFEAICNTYKAAKSIFDDISFIIPCGTALQNARGTKLGIEHNDFASSEADASHINQYGTLITSLVYFNKLYGGEKNVSLDIIHNDYSTLLSDEDFALAIKCAKTAIKIPFKYTELVM